jgi:ABC-type glycerol-3-phosphate transport system substrate-binding protein
MMRLIKLFFVVSLLVVIPLSACGGGSAAPQAPTSDNLTFMIFYKEG